MREKLIKLLLNCYDEPNLRYYDLTEITDKCMGGAEYLADYLLANGVVVLPCKVGDTVFVIPTKENGLSEIAEMCCIGFSLGDPNDTVNLLNDKNKLYQPSFDKFGKTVFLTKEEAEAALEASNATP